jgi:hypothetical protein
MSTRHLSDSAQLSRAAEHLIENHGSRAAAVAIKRAANLYQSGEHVGADTWRKIAGFVHAIEAGKDPPLHKAISDISFSAILPSPVSPTR